MSRYVLLLWGWRKNCSSSFTLITTGRIETYQITTYSIKTLLKMNYWSPKHIELLKVMNKINHQTLCILLDYRYIAKWYTVHTISYFHLYLKWSISFLGKTKMRCFFWCCSRERWVSSCILDIVHGFLLIIQIFSFLVPMSITVIFSCYNYPFF